MTEQEAFVTRLRRRRERNRIPLEEIAQDTRVKLELLQELEQNDLSNWPRGLYARATEVATSRGSSPLACRFRDSYLARLEDR
jgi:hypothetical protein